MRLLAFILSFVIFSQSLAVCGPHLQTTVHKTLSGYGVEKNSCHAETKNCCSKEKDKAKDNHEKKGCCDQGCKCFCCIKVFVTEHLSSNINPLFDLFIERNQIPVFTHSFDFHQDVSYPPQNKI